MRKHIKYGRHFAVTSENLMSSWWHWLIFEALLRVLDPVVPEIVVLMMIREVLEATAQVVALVGAVHVMNVPLLISWPVVVLSHRLIHRAHCTGNSLKWLYSWLILHPVCEDSLNSLNNGSCGDRHWKLGSVLTGECSSIHICIHIFIPKLIYIQECLKHHCKRMFRKCCRFS